MSRVRFREYVAGVIAKVIAIYVTTDSSERSRTGIGPDVCLQVLVRAINTFIDHPDDDIPAALGNVPRLRGPDQIHPIELIEGWIVWRRLDVTDEIWFRVDNIVACL